MPDELQQLMRVQEHDSALDALHYRRESLPERARLQACLDEAKTLLPRQQQLRADREVQAREEARLESEIESFRAKMAEVDTKLYSGTVTSPRELQSLQADIEQLRHHISHLEDDELEHMALREALDGELAPIDARLVDLRAEVGALQAAIAAAEQAIAGEVEVEERARADAAAAVAAPLLADYDARRKRNRGRGAALLVGDTCQACRLTIPATEVDEIRHNATGRIWYCDNCGAILIAS